MIGPDGAAVAGASVGIQSGASTPAEALVWNPSEARTTQTDHEGVFGFENLHGGRYSLRARYQEWLGALDGLWLTPRSGPIVLLRTMLPSDNLRSHHTTVQVVGGQRTALTIDVPAGTVTLMVEGQPRPGHQVPAAELFLFAGEVAFATRRELISKLFTDGYDLGRWRADATEAVAFRKLVPGSYTICTVPLAWDPDDPAFEQRLADESNTLAVFCTPVCVEAAPTEQLVSVEVPSLPS